MSMQARPHPRDDPYFEDIRAASLFPRRPKQMVMPMDDMSFSNMTLPPPSLPIDAPSRATGTGWVRPLMGSLGLLNGISVRDTTIAHPGMTEVRFPAPRFEGDSVRRPS